MELVISGLLLKGHAANFVLQHVASDASQNLQEIFNEVILYLLPSILL